MVLSNANLQIQKRELTIVDKTNFSVRITLWGKQAEDYNIEDCPVIAFKGVKVGDFGGRSLSMYSSSTMSVNPDIDEAHVLRGWWDAFGSETTFQSHTSSYTSAGNAGAFDRASIRNLNEVKTSGVGTHDGGAENFCSRATIMHVKSDNVSYPACPKEGCNKKVTEMGGQGWRCEKCDQTYPKPEYRYILSMAVADWSGQAWLQGFNEAGLAVFGKTADELQEIRVSAHDAFFRRVAEVLITFCRNEASQSTMSSCTSHLLQRITLPAALSRIIITLVTLMYLVRIYWLMSCLLSGHHACTLRYFSFSTTSIRGGGSIPSRFVDESLGSIIDIISFEFCIVFFYCLLSSTFSPDQCITS